MGWDVVVEINGGEFRFSRGGGFAEQSIVSGQVQLRKVTKKSKTGSTATLAVSDPNLSISNSLPLPTKNDKIEAKIWIGSGPILEPVFVGYLDKFQTSTSARVTQLRFGSKAKTMRRKSRVKSFGDRAAKELIEHIVGLADEDLVVDFTDADLDDVVFSQVLQHGETDLEVLSRLLEGVGHFLWMYDNNVVIAKNGTTRTTKRPTPTFTFGETLVDVTFGVEERKIKTTGNVFDFAGNKQGTDDGEAEDRPASLERLGLVLTESEFPSFTDEAITKSKKSIGRKTEVFQARLNSSDFIPLYQDDFVILRGYGSRWSGVWKVKSVAHDFARGQTSVQLYNGGTES